MSSPTVTGLGEYCWPKIAMFETAKSNIKRRVRIIADKFSFMILSDSIIVLDFNGAKHRHRLVGHHKTNENILIPIVINKLIEGVHPFGNRMGPNSKPAIKYSCFLCAPCMSSAHLLEATVKFQNYNSISSHCTPCSSSYSIRIFGCFCLIIKYNHF